MGLREIVLSGVNTAFNAAGNLVKTGKYRAVAVTSTSPGVPTLTPTDYTVEYVCEDYNERKHGQNIWGAQSIFYVPFESLSITPKQGDRFVDESGQVWQVLNYLNCANLNVLLGILVKR